MNSIKRGLIAQKNYSAQSCVKGFDCQIEPVLDSRKCAYSLPMERSPNRARIRARENTIASDGKYRRFKRQRMSTILYEERKDD